MSSYDPKSMAGGLAGELERLEAQADLTWESELEILNHLGIGSASQILEVGHGSGAFLSRLSARLPGAHLTGVEPEQSLYDISTGQHALRTSNVTLINQDLSEFSKENPSSFDFVLARMVFQHLTNPDQAALEIYNLLKPNGTVAVIDVDGGLWGIASPMDYRLGLIQQKAWESQGQRGGNRFIGRSLTKILVDAGLCEVRLDLAVADSTTLGIDNFVPLIDPVNLVPLVESGVLSLDDYKLAVTGFKKFMENRNSIVQTVNFVASGRRGLAK